MSAHREVTFQAGGAKGADERPVVIDVELEYEREPYQERRSGLRRLDDLLRVLLDVQHLYGVAVPAQHRGEIPEPQIPLVLEADEHDGARGVAPALVCGGTLQDA